MRKICARVYTRFLFDRQSQKPDNICIKCYVMYITCIPQYIICKCTYDADTADKKKRRFYIYTFMCTNNGRTCSFKTEESAGHKNAYRHKQETLNCAPSENFDILLLTSSLPVFVSVSAHVAYICARLPAYVYINPFITSFLSFLAIAVVVVVGIVVSRVCTYYTCPHGSNSFLVYLIACSRLLLLLSFSIKQKKSEREKKNSSILNEQQQTEKKREKNEEWTFFCSIIAFRRRKNARTIQKC